MQDIISIDTDRVTRTRNLTSAFIELLCYSTENQIDYAELEIETFVNLNQQFSAFHGDTKKHLFITFIVDELTHNIKTLEDNVYHLEIVLMQMLALGTLSKLTTEFGEFNKSFDLSQLHALHARTKSLFYDIIQAGNNNGDWDVFKLTTASPIHYSFNPSPEEDYKQVVDSYELKDITDIMIETSYVEAANGAADFIILNNGLLAWADKKFYL